MPGTWKLKKKRAASCDHSIKSSKNDIQRSKSNKEVFTVQKGTRRRTSTVSGGSPARSKSAMGFNSTKKESPEHFYTLDRHYMRRPALIQPTDQETTTPTSQLIGNFIIISLEDGNVSFRKTVAVHDDSTLENILVSTFYTQGFSQHDFSKYSITATKGGVQIPVDLNESSRHYLASVIELKLHEDVDQTDNSPNSPNQMTVQSCLDFFNKNGLKEIPSVGRIDEDSYHLPRVQPLDPIEKSWEELPIDPDLKKSLSSVELAQQQTIWELISTEHSFLRQLETIINLFMRSLELIRRVDLLTEVNYHNIFGYMEEIYISHDQFWTWTLQPCLERVHTDHCPLDLNDIILRFPERFSNDFDVYEQHCAFETTNLRSLDEAMSRADFKAYVEWCESQPECNRLKLKDFLAKPMQRLTKYKLLFAAILKKTTDPSCTTELKQIMEEVSLFVDSVNGVLRAQAESSRVEEVMKKIIGYSPVEVQGELKEFIQPHTHLDLLAPMPDVDVTKPRILVLEGKLRFRDQHANKIVAHVFLFSDMLLITKPVKPVKKGTENYVVIRPPYKISNVQVELRDGGTICCIVLNEFRVLSTVFTLKSHSPLIAREWMDQITAAQEFYDSAVQRKCQTWHILHSLRQERILHGISQDLCEPIQSTNHRTSVGGVSPILPKSSGIGFRRVASNESTLSSNSSLAFPFDLQLSTSPHGSRRGTLPTTLPGRSGSDSHKKSPRLSTPFLLSPADSAFENWSASSKRSSFGPCWSRTASLNTLLEKHSDHSDTTINERNTHCLNVTLVDVATQTDPIQPHPLSHPSKIIEDSDSNSDDEDYLPLSLCSPVNPLESPTDHVRKMGQHHRVRSNPTNSAVNTNTYILDTNSPDLVTPFQNDPIQEESIKCEPSTSTCPLQSVSLSSNEGSTDSSFLEQTPEGCNSSSSLMTEIIKELSKNDNDVRKNLQLFNGQSSYVEHTDTSETRRQRSLSLHSNFHFYSNLEKRLNTRRSAIQLTNILESKDEESDESDENNTNSSYFQRNSKLRRSKSSFELSFNHRRTFLKHPSPLTTHMMRRSNEHIFTPEKLDVGTSPVLPSAFEHKFESSGEEDNTRDKEAKRNSLKLPIKEENTTNQEKSSWFSRRSKRAFGLSPIQSKRSLLGLIRGKAVSMETGMNEPISTRMATTPSKTTPQDGTPSVQFTRRHKLSLSPNQQRPRIMYVIASDSNLQLDRN